MAVVGQNAVEDFDPEKLLEARVAAGLSQRELARRTGVPASTLAKWEGGFQRPYAGKLAALAAALGLPPTAFTSHDPGETTLAQLRIAAGLTQAEAAARAGLVRSRYSAIERGEIAAVAHDVAAAIAAALGVGEAELRTAHGAARAMYLRQR
jgi:transcriptional regulator with XRE-family HTH domain